MMRCLVVIKVDVVTKFWCRSSKHETTRALASVVSFNEVHVALYVVLHTLIYLQLYRNIRKRDCWNYNWLKSYFFVMLRFTNNENSLNHVIPHCIQWIRRTHFHLCSMNRPNFNKSLQMNVTPLSLKMCRYESLSS